MQGVGVGRTVQAVDCAVNVCMAPTVTLSTGRVAVLLAGKVATANDLATPDTTDPTVSTGRHRVYVRVNVEPVRRPTIFLEGTRRGARLPFQGRGVNNTLLSVTLGHQCWRRSIVVRTLVSAGELSLSCAKLLAG